MTVLRLPRDTLHRVCSYLEPLLLVRLLSVSSTFRSKICSAPIDLSPDCFGDRYLTCSELLVRVLHTALLVMLFARVPNALYFISGWLASASVTTLTWI